MKTRWKKYRTYQQKQVLNKTFVHGRCYVCAGRRRSASTKSSSRLNQLSDKYCTWHRYEQRIVHSIIKRTALSPHNGYIHISCLERGKMERNQPDDTATGTGKNVLLGNLNARHVLWHRTTNQLCRSIRQMT